MFVSTAGMVDQLREHEVLEARRRRLDPAEPACRRQSGGVSFPKKASASAIAARASVSSGR